MRSILSALLILLLLLIMAISWLFSAQGLQKSINMFLMPQFEIVSTGDLQFKQRNLILPAFKVISHQEKKCELMSLTPASVSLKKKLSIQNVQLNYACLQNVLNAPSHNKDKTPLKLTALLALIPDSEVDIHSLNITDVETLQEEHLQQLLSSTIQLNAIYKDKKLHLKGKATDQSAVILSLNSALENKVLTGNIHYQPKKDHQHKINFSLNVKEEFMEMPSQSKIDYQWQNAQYFLPKGNAKIEWKGNSGNILLQDNIQHQQRLNIPFKINNNQLDIKQATFDWDLVDAQPLKGVLDLSIIPENSDFINQPFPFKSNFRISLFSQGEMGKGNVVIQAEDAFIAKEKINIPLQATGNFKYEDAIAYSQLPMLINGDLSDPVLNFLPGSLLRITGKNEYLTIDEIRLPLAGVKISRYGLKGRLQAILKGTSPQFSQIKFHLDGQANEFIAGIKSVFSIHSPSLKNKEQQLKNSWQWRFWGQAHSTALNSTLQTNGKGSWINDTIMINALNGKMKKIDLGGIKTQKLNLSVVDPIIWKYEKKQLSGKLKVISPEFTLNYGGKFIQPEFSLEIIGQDINHFNLAGILTAGKLGPIKIFARYFDRNIVGNIYWLEQSARVFQPLFPFRWNWVIKTGTIRGQTAFSITPKTGFVAGGYFAIRAGHILLPNGRVEGVEFALPYQFRNSRVELGLKTPVEVFIDKIYNGNLVLSEIRSKVQGYYPYNKKRPLRLSELSIHLLGGKLNINQFALPQTKIANVQLSQIDLTQVLSLLHQDKQLTMTGRVDALFPFWLQDKSCIVCQGELIATSPVHLKLSPALTEELKKGGITESILIGLLNELNLQHLTAKVDLSTSGWLTLQAKIQGYNPQKEPYNPITLNYNHKENLFDLWKSLDYGSNMEQHIEHRLYEKLDR